MASWSSSRRKTERVPCPCVARGTTSARGRLRLASLRSLTRYGLAARDVRSILWHTPTLMGPYSGAAWPPFAAHARAVLAAVALPDPAAKRVIHRAAGLRPCVAVGAEQRLWVVHAGPRA